MAYYQKFKGSVFIILCAFECVFGICDVSQCVNQSRCALDENERSCRCATGYFGDLCDQVVTMNLVCGEDFVALSVSEDFFKYHNVSIESVHLSKPDCRAKKEVIAGVLYYTVRTMKDKYEDCGSQPVERNMTHVVYSLTLMSDPKVYKNIVRDPVIKIKFKCVYPYVRSVSLPYPIFPLSSETLLQVDELDVKVEMSTYKDQTYTEAFSNIPRVHFKDRVFVQVSVTQPKELFSLRVDECWATQTPQPNDTSSLSHTLLLNGCVNDETVSFVTTSDKYPNDTVDYGHEGLNGQNSTVRFSFEMFRFAVEPHEFYLHCAVRLCTRDPENSCVPECKAIIKREAAVYEPPQGLLSYGPIRVEVPEMAKNDVYLTVVLPVAVIWTLALFLLILIGLAKALDKRLPPPLT